MRERLLRPARHDASTYLEEDVPEARLAHGYVRRGDALVREGRDPYGALASMGGLFSSVRDLARWVAGFLDAFPARDDPEGAHPLRRASRREMQQVQRAFGAEVARPRARREPVVRRRRLRLWAVHRAATRIIGTVVSHSGGYPGFGSAWRGTRRPASGVIALGNLRYAPVGPVAAGAAGRPSCREGGVPRRRVRPCPASALPALVEGLVAHWDDAVADAAFAMNMDLDEPRDRRRAAVAKVAADLGPFRPDDVAPRRPSRPPTWRGGCAASGAGSELEILVTPEPEPRIQTLRVTPVGDPSAALVAGGGAAAGRRGEPAPAWPADLPRAAALDPAAIERALRAASPRFGSACARPAASRRRRDLDDLGPRHRARPRDAQAWALDAGVRRRDGGDAAAAAGSRPPRAGRRGLAGPRPSARGRAGVTVAPIARGQPLQHAEPVEAAGDLRGAQRHQAVGRHQVGQHAVQDRLDLVAERVAGGPHAVGLERDVRQQADDQVVRLRPAADQRLGGEGVRRRRTTAGSTRSCPSRRGP